MSGKSNEERKKEFLEMQAAFKNMMETLKSVNRQITQERKSFEVIESETVRLVVCKN